MTASLFSRACLAALICCGPSAVAHARESESPETAQTQAPRIPGQVRLRNLVYRRPENASEYFHLLGEPKVEEKQAPIVKTVGYGYGLGMYRPRYYRPWYYGPRSYAYSLYRPWYAAPYRYGGLRYRYFSPAYRRYSYYYAPWYQRGYGVPYGPSYWSYSPVLAQPLLGSAMPGQPFSVQPPLPQVTAPCPPIQGLPIQASPIQAGVIGGRNYSGCFYW